GEGLYEVDLPLTSRIRADIEPDGVPGMIDGHVVVEKGFIIDVDDALVRIPIDRAEILLASAGSPAWAPLIINRLRLQLRVDPVTRRVDIEEGELGNAEIGVALSGGIDCAGDDPRVAVSVAGTPMSVIAMKRLWP